ncbi:hypothetical protein N431DRAFT_554557 [Stipitochalara longipes BDJ]|nr:hypothetical protein N431DRAFT_554557 [Stipitochalara longipes BDJ]
MGSCTDQSFSGGSCFRYCPAGSNNIVACRPQSKGNYCCGTNQSCCSSGQDVFQLGVLAQASSIPFTTLTGIPSSTTESATTTQSSTLSTSLSVATSTTEQTSATANFFEASPTAVPTSSAVNTPPSSGIKTGTKVGITVGVIGGFAIVGFLVYFLIFLLKRHKQEKYNAERVAQIQAKVRGTFNSENSGNGSFDRLGSTSGTAAFDFSRTGTPNSLADSVRRPLPPVPLQLNSRSHQEPYTPYQQLSTSLTHELRHLEPLAVAQHTQLPSHYSFSGPPVLSPLSPREERPPQRMTPVEDFAAAQLPSHFSFTGQPIMSPISPIEGSNEPPPNMTSIHQVTSPISPVEGSNEPPPRMTPAQIYAAAQLPSHFSFAQPPPVTSSISPTEDPTRRPLGIQEMAAATLPSHYSFDYSFHAPPSGYVRPRDVPERSLTPAQELASARLRSNMSPMGLAGMDD